MERRFFDLKIDVYVPGRWYLTTPTTLDGRRVDYVWEFSDGKRMEYPERLRVPVSRPGKPLDYSSAGVGLTPVVNERIASVFRDIAPGDVQLFPVSIDDQRDEYFLLNVAHTVRCIDDAACGEVQFYGPDDGRPDLIGEYRAVLGLRIDKTRVGDERVFRLWGWRTPIIVDGELKDALERAGITGGRFDEV